MSARIIERQFDVVENAHQLGFLIDRITERLGGEVAAVRDLACGTRPVEEAHHQWPHMAVTQELLTGEVPKGNSLQVDESRMALREGPRYRPSGRLRLISVRLAAY